MDGNKMLTYPKKKEYPTNCSNLSTDLSTLQLHMPEHTTKNVLTFQSKHEDVFIQTNVRLPSNERSFFLIGDYHTFTRFSGAR